MEKLDTLSQDQGLRSVYQLFLHKNTYLLSYLNFLNFVNFLWHKVYGIFNNLNFSEKDFD